MKPEKRLPLVLAATETAAQEAERLGLSSLENAVHAAILEGRIAHVPRDGEHTSVYLSRELCARVLRTRSPSGRRAWLPVGVGRSRAWT